MIKPALSLIVAAVLAVVATLVAPAVGAKEPPKGTSSITLPEKPNEIPAFVAELDDKQARSTLVKVLEERTKPAEAEKLDLFAAAKRATSRIASRIDELAGARGEAALSPVVFWRWLTSDGSDQGALVRMLVTAFAVLVGVGLPKLPRPRGCGAPSPGVNGAGCHHWPGASNSRCSCVGWSSSVCYFRCRP